MQYLAKLRNNKGKNMWYFSWILGVLLAVSLGIINVMWYEMEQHVDNLAKDQDSDKQS